MRTATASGAPQYVRRSPSVSACTSSPTPAKMRCSVQVLCVDVSEDFFDGALRQRNKPWVRLTVVRDDHCRLVQGEAYRANRVTTPGLTLPAAAGTRRPHSRSPEVEVRHHCKR